MQIKIKKEHLISINIDFFHRIVKYVFYNGKKPRVLKTGGEKIMTFNCIFSSQKIFFENYKACGLVNENFTMDKLKYYIMRMDNRPIIFGKKIDEQLLHEFYAKDIILDEPDFLPANKKTSYNFVVLDCEMLEIQNSIYKNENPSHLSVASNCTSDSNYKADMTTTRYAARITIMDNTYKIIYDQHIIPPTKVVNFHFKNSGLMRSSFANAVPLHKAQKEALNIIGKNTVVIGHSVIHDLNIIKINTTKIIDIAVMFIPHNGKYISLKDLCRIYLDRTIQKNFHCSAEDCAATLELFFYAMSSRIFLHNGKITEHVSENYAKNKLNILQYSEEVMGKISDEDLSIVFYLDDGLIKFYVL